MREARYRKRSGDMIFLKDRIFKIFEDAMKSANAVQMDCESTWSPPVDIYETETEFVVKAEVPEVKGDDLSIKFESNILTIEGERMTKRSELGGYHRIERPYGRFRRSFVLPDPVDKDSIRATLHNGVLNIILPKNR